jgi:hypothetical protein
MLDNHPKPLDGYSIVVLRRSGVRANDPDNAKHHREGRESSHGCTSSQFH